MQFPLNHTQRVKSLYKRAARMIEAWYDRREVIRYHVTLLRARFDSHCVSDPYIAEGLVSDGEEELFLNSHWHVRKFPQSPGGTDYQRVVPAPDWVLDYWHPLEKQQYPDYFARREKRKIEYVKMWSELYVKRPYDDPCPDGSEETPLVLKPCKPQDVCKPFDKKKKTEDDECGDV